MPKKIDHQQRKKDILHKALELFSSRGYEATTLADIAKAARIARPTLYQYFRDKHQILFFASKQFTDEFMVHYQQIIEMKQYAAAHRLRFVLSHIVLSCRQKRRELVSQSAFILKLEQEGRSIANLIHKRVRPLKSLLGSLLEEIQADRTAEASPPASPASINLGLPCVELPANIPALVDLLLTLVTSGMVHVLLFPQEDCQAVLQHIGLVIQLLSTSPQLLSVIPGRREEEYHQVHAELLSAIAEMERSLEEKNEGQKRPDVGPSGEDPEEHDLDAEWDEFLNPFRSLK